MCNKMSDVRLSNASPTLERVDARQADSFRPSVRRNLFGTPDSEEIRRYVTAMLQEDVQSFRERYDFDPVEERPLSPGQNYEWEVDGDAPEFYRRAPHWSRRKAQPRAEESSGAAERNGSRKRHSEGSGPCSSECQSKIRHTGEDDEDDESKGAGSLAARAAEQRPSGPEYDAEVH